eukprot:15703687-Heterocapsa_arctica.AAC.1
MGGELDLLRGVPPRDRPPGVMSVVELQLISGVAASGSERRNCRWCEALFAMGQTLNIDGPNIF